MEVCDRVQTDQNGAKEAVQSMIKRLAHRNANVQLYTLEVGQTRYRAGCSGSNGDRLPTLSPKTAAK